MQPHDGRNRGKNGIACGALLAALVLAGSPTAPRAAEHAHEAPGKPATGADVQPTNGALRASVTLTQETEDEDVFLVARVSDGSGAALAGQMVAFSVPRLFGTLILERAETDEDGLASIPFPTGLPGDAQTGDLTITAALCDSEAISGEAVATFSGGRTLKINPNPFPREIWSPRTDWHLLVTIPVLLGCVWSVYCFAIRQLLRLKKVTNGHGDPGV